jgi:hypothetical protein
MTVPKRKRHQDDGDSDKRSRQEEALDEALKNTFPASDPVSVEQPTTSGRACRSSTHDDVTGTPTLERKAHQL